MCSRTNDSEESIVNRGIVKQDIKENILQLGGEFTESETRFHHFNDLEYPTQKKRRYHKKLARKLLTPIICPVGSRRAGRVISKVPLVSHSNVYAHDCISKTHD